jgi:hypothetical protein
MERRYFSSNRQEVAGTCFGKEKKSLRRLMLFLALLAAMMLVASPVLAHQGGPTHGNKYPTNYYPNSWYKYCEKGGSQTYGPTKASKWCEKYYTEYQKKWNNGKQYYYVHVYYHWKTPDGNWHKQGYWYYCQYHKYNDPHSKRPYFKAWVTYKPTGKHYWESFYWHS